MKNGRQFVKWRYKYREYTDLEKNIFKRMEGLQIFVSAPNHPPLPSKVKWSTLN